MKYLFYIIAVILLVCWGIGLALKIAGGLIHILLVVALISIVLNIVFAEKLSS